MGCRQSAVHQTIAFFVGRRCRASTLKDVAKELNSDWHTVKGLEKQYMREQLRLESGVKTTISACERFELVDFAEYVVDQVL